MWQPRSSSRSPLAVLAALTLPLSGLATPNTESPTRPPDNSPNVEAVAAPSSLDITDVARARFPRVCGFLDDFSALQASQGLSDEDVDTFTASMRVFLRSDIAGRDLTQEEQVAVTGLTEPQFNQYLVEHGLIWFNEFDQPAPGRYVLGSCFGLHEVVHAPATFGADAVIGKVVAGFEQHGFTCPPDAQGAPCLIIKSALVSQEVALGRRLGTCVELNGAYAIVLNPEDIKAVAEYMPGQQKVGLWAATLANEFVHVRNRVLFPNPDAEQRITCTVGGRKLEGTWVELNEASSDLGSLLVTRPEWNESLALPLTQALTGRQGRAYGFSDRIVAHVGERVLGEEYQELQQVANETDFSDRDQFAKLLARCASAVSKHPNFRSELIGEYVRALEALK